jgi:diguanylate cyclase (GGDEF)-like protein
MCSNQADPVADDESRRGERRRGVEKADRRQVERRRTDRRGTSARGAESSKAGGSARKLPPFPTRQADVPRWIRQQLDLPPELEQALIEGIDSLWFRQEQLWERSKADAIDALVAGFTSKINRLRQELSARDAAVHNIAQYFERVISELTVRAGHDPKTRLMNFTRFLEHLELYLNVEQRGLWCAVGLVDITSFKWYNDTLGHAVGDRIIERVARLLQEQVRADDVVAHDTGQELHARFGGDEFCFLIPNLDDVATASAVADRFRDAVRRHDWRIEDERLAEHPVTVDVGVACLLLGSIADRRRMGPQLARELLNHADKLMYAAKADAAAHAYPVALRIENQSLVEIPSGEAAY